MLHNWKCLWRHTSKIIITVLEHKLLRLWTDKAFQDLRLNIFLLSRNHRRLRFRILNMHVLNWFRIFFVRLRVLLLISWVMLLHVDDLLILLPLGRTLIHFWWWLNDSTLNEHMVLMHLLDTSSLLELVLIESFNVLIETNLHLTEVLIVETFLPFLEVILELGKLVGGLTLLWILIYISLLLPGRTQLGHWHRVEDVIGTPHLLIAI